jgi:hypothetical protein
MLAIKSALAAHDAIPLLVFDEIDTNVGGEIATRRRQAAIKGPEWRRIQSEKRRTPAIPCQSRCEAESRRLRLLFARAGKVEGV